MENIVWFIALIPLLGFVVNALFGNKWKEAASSGVAIVSVLLAFMLSVVVFLKVAADPSHSVESSVLPWLAASGIELSIPFQLHIGPLNSGMLLVITGVGTLIHIYSASYMHGDKGFSRYFSYLNLFVFFMTVLVMAANLPVLFVGWEGVGLASYLLIGFWQEKWSATQAAKKAFIVNRIGDVALLIAMFMLYRQFGTLDLYGPSGILSMYKNVDSAILGVTFLTLVPVLIFVGAVGKSAQLPLFVWLPDAMEGPTPVSALIHAATMVTAGIYLVCRMHPLFERSHISMEIVAWTGALTAVSAACAGVAQWDIKKVLAYSTVSQLGLMFVACGVGAFSAAMFHVTTHAFFKALLFLGAGSVIHALNGEQDMRRMGGLSSVIKSTHVAVLIGTIAISGIPPLAGFWSKDEILLSAFDHNRSVYYLAALTSALTAFYMWRMYTLTFLGQSRLSSGVKEHIHHPNGKIVIPLIMLSVLSILSGFLNAPAIGVTLYQRWLNPVLSQSEHSPNANMVMAVSVLVAITCSLLGYLRYRSQTTETLAKSNAVFEFFHNAWYLDAFYYRVVTKPLELLADWSGQSFERNGAAGLLRSGRASVAGLGKLVARWQSGVVNDYMLTAIIGVIVLITVALVTVSRGGN